MTPQEQLIKLLHSYNPDLPMGEGMKAQFLALRDECDRSAGKKVGELTLELGMQTKNVMALMQYVGEALTIGYIKPGFAQGLLSLLEELAVTEVSPDANVERNRKMLLDRSKVGLEKYGVTTERTDLTPAQWAQHAIEEALDFANYLQALKSKLGDLDNG